MPSGADRRRAPRYPLHVPVQLNGTASHNVEMVDISATGMQLRSGQFDIFKGRGYQKNRQEQLKLNIVARLAWAEPDDNGGFLTGWAFDVVDEPAQAEGQEERKGDDGR